MAKPSELLATATAVGEPMVVYTGPKRTGAALIAAVAADDQKQVTRKRGKKSRVTVAAKKPDPDAPKTAARTEAKSDAKPAAKPATVRHANAKPDTSAAKPKSAAKPAEKPAASGDKPAAKPAAKPKAAAKPKSETKPAG